MINPTLKGSSHPAGASSYVLLMMLGYALRANPTYLTMPKAPLRGAALVRPTRLRSGWPVGNRPRTAKGVQDLLDGEQRRRLEF